MWYRWPTGFACLAVAVASYRCSVHSLVSSVKQRPPKSQQRLYDSRFDVTPLLARQIRIYGANLTTSIDMLKARGVPVPLNSNTSLNSDEMLRYEQVFMSLLDVVGRAQKQEIVGVDDVDLEKASRDNYAQQAMDLYRQCPTENCRARAISICGYQAKGYSFALRLLRHSEAGSPSLQSYHAALAACANQKDWSEALHILKFIMPMKTTMSCNIVLKAMCRAGQGERAHALLLDMIQERLNGHDVKWPMPDRCSFHLTMKALCVGEAKKGGDNGDATHLTRNTDKAFSLLNDMWALDDLCRRGRTKHDLKVSLRPNNATLELIASSYGKLGDWGMVNYVDNVLRSDPRFEKSSPGQHSEERLMLDPALLRSLKCQTKSPLLHRWRSENFVMKKNRNEKYWSIGRYESSSINCTVALQPNRNPSKNGIKVVLLDAYGSSSNVSSKLGYLLMVNKVDDSGDASSNLLGMFLHPRVRKMGLSKAFLAIWLDLCQRRNLAPRTGAIHKPLLALVLQHTFGFEPECGESAGCSIESAKQSGVLVEISRGSDGRTVDLYAPTAKSLLGLFSPWDLKRENVRILQTCSSPRGRPCRIGTSLVAGNSSKFLEAVTDQIAGKSRKGRLVYNLVHVHWRDVLLGSNNGEVPTV
jgi:pentatricopeptide repeat protein